MRLICLAVLLALLSPGAASATEYSSLDACRNSSQAYACARDGGYYNCSVSRVELVCPRGCTAAQCGDESSGCDLIGRQIYAGYCGTKRADDEVVVPCDDYDSPTSCQGDEPLSVTTEVNDDADTAEWDTPTEPSTEPSTDCL